MKSKLHSEAELNRARFELEVHASLKNRFVIPFLGGEETVDSFVLVTPLAIGDLNSLTTHKVLSEYNCRNLCHQLLNGLTYLHNEIGLVHCDIKPANILVFRNGKSLSVCICDFGFSEYVVSGTNLPYSGMRGSLGYFSPEQLNRQEYGHPVDMFALGIIIYTLLCGYEPFYPSNKAGLMYTDSTVLQFESPYWDNISPKAIEFIKSLLCGNPQTRLSANDALVSPWIASTPQILSPQANSEDDDIQFADPREFF